MLRSTTLRPGLLVSLKTSVRGNIDYQKRTIEQDTTTETGALRAKWETTRIISDPAEHEAAEKARSKASSLVRGVCVRSEFGLLCAEKDAEQLEDAIRQARIVADEFNATARLSHVSVYVITGRVAGDDVEAVRAINSEVRDLLENMAAGVQAFDVDRIRDAANRARNIGAMLPTETQAKVQQAIDAARSAARQMVKAGETAAQEIDAAALRRITDARTAFLDLDDAQEIATPQETGRALDLEPRPQMGIGWNEQEFTTAPAIDLNEPTAQTAAPAAPQLALEV